VKVVLALVLLGNTKANTIRNTNPKTKSSTNKLLLLFQGP
jgi:hypothetical protein